MKHSDCIVDVQYSIVSKFVWRYIFQSLLLLNYLLRNGSERVVTSTREHMYDLRQLEDFTATDEFGRDQGVNGSFHTV